MNYFENYLNNIGIKQLLMVYSTIVVLIVFSVYTLSNPLLQEEELLISQIKMLETSIAKNKSSTLKKEIAFASKELISLKSEVEIEKEKITSFIASLYRIKYAFFNEMEFANALDEILQSSIKTKLDVHYIKNIPLKTDESISIVKHKKRLEISGSGGYKEIIALMNHIENLESLLKFDNVLLQASENNVTFKFIIDLYGIGL